MEHVEVFLKHIGLGQYVNTFEDNGYDSLDTFFVMDDHDFEIFGPYVKMLPGHLQRLKKQVYAMKKNTSRTARRLTRLYHTAHARSPFFTPMLLSKCNP